MCTVAGVVGTKFLCASPPHPSRSSFLYRDDFPMDDTYPFPPVAIQSLPHSSFLVPFLYLPTQSHPSANALLCAPPPPPPPTAH
mmetsp:Transcript_2848/g.6027  ORF Transcript_2848/g.6027 Transcript_2848/m.6027 type:complete len:84 (-) Transcript_2848:798-1049(-)